LTLFAYLTQFNKNYQEKHTVPVAVNPAMVIAFFPVEKLRSKYGEPHEKVMTTFIQYASETEADHGGVYVIETFDEVRRLFGSLT
jgi:hypothetical protein